MFPDLLQAELKGGPDYFREKEAELAFSVIFARVDWKAVKFCSK